MHEKYDRHVRRYTITCAMAFDLTELNVLHFMFLVVNETFSKLLCHKLPDYL